METKHKSSRELLKNSTYIGKGIIKLLSAFILLFLLFLYYQTEIYDFKQTKTANDSEYYNPYLDWDNNSLLKANFHSHSKAWAGITNGHDTEKEIFDQYKKLGYDVAAVSNYHNIQEKSDSNMIKIPCYEQGFNKNKIHFLSIGSQKVVNLDFPILQNISQKQQRLNLTKKHSNLIALAHPGLFNAYTTDDMTKLEGYDLFEVLNPYFESFELWDYALNNERSSWILASDDTHDLKKQPAGRFFNMIYCTSKKSDSVIKALKNGKHVSYKSTLGLTDVNLDHIKINKDKIVYSFSGQIINVKLNRNGQEEFIDAQGEILINKNDKFLRFVVKGAKSELYTNPIMKKSVLQSKHLLGNHKINLRKTFQYRLSVLMIFGIFTILIFKRPNKRIILKPRTI